MKTQGHFLNLMNHNDPPHYLPSQISWYIKIGEPSALS